jgi:hypothetical protein
MFMKLFINVMIRNIKTNNILDIIEIPKSMEPNKCSPKSNCEKKYLNVFNDFSKFNGSRKIKV